jgi:excisionase family DNA binding protein
MKQEEYENWDLTVPKDATCDRNGDCATPLNVQEPVVGPPAVLTVDELASMLRVNRKTLYASFRAGEIPGGRRIGAAIRFSRDAVLRWLAEGCTTRPSRGPR